MRSVDDTFYAISPNPLILNSHQEDLSLFVDGKKWRQVFDNEKGVYIYASNFIQATARIIELIDKLF